MAKNATNGRTNGYQATHALLYSRVSTDDQAREGLSLPVQQTDTRRYAAQAGWIIAGEFSDVLSGSVDERPGYVSLLAEVRRLRGEARPVSVVVARLDRLGRRLAERARCADEFRTLGVPLHSVAEGGETPPLLAGILAVMAEDETRRLGERVRTVCQHTASLGWFLPGAAPLGYRLRPRTAEEKAAGAPASVLEVDPDRAPIVVEMFRRAAAGASVRAVAFWLMSLPAEARRGGVYGRVSVWRLLTSPAYVGRSEHGDPDVLARPRGRWEPLVSDALWRQVQDRRLRHTQLPNQASGRYLLTGLARCPRCGARMAGDYYCQGSARRCYYRCRAEDRGAASTDLPCRFSVPTRHVDAAVLAEVGRVVGALIRRDAEMPGEVRREWQRLMQPDDADDVAGQVAALERKAERARRRLTDAALLLVDGALDRAGYELARDAARADLDAAEAEIVRLRGTAKAPALPPLDEVLALAGDWLAMLTDPDVSTAARREVLALMVEKVVPVRIARATYRTDIAWTPQGAAIRTLAGGAGTAGTG